MRGAWQRSETGTWIRWHLVNPSAPVVTASVSSPPWELYHIQLQLPLVIRVDWRFPGRQCVE